MERPIRVSLLGPTEVLVGDEMTPIAGTKLQSLVALLALAVPHPVADGRLVDELWGDAQPARAANALQALVSHLRRLLGRSEVVRRGSGYALAIDPDEVDAIRLERLVRRAREESRRGAHGSAADSFRSAVELVRGEPLAELVDRWFARDAAARLEEMVLAAQEGLIDSELAMGHHAEVVDRIAELVRHHPLRERFRAQLIVALYRRGRQAEALQTYRDARRYLLEELGVDPCPELRALERSVLAHDPALAAPIAVASPVAVRAALPLALTSFIGRHRELRDIAASHRGQRLVSLVGTAGVGKSRLALEFARALVSEHEVWFVELAPVADGNGVPEAVANGLGAPERPASRAPATPSERAVERLGDRHATVIMDNCEHVVDAAAAIVVDILRGCPNVRIVTTSREPLHVDGEHEVRIGPLDAADAAALFVQRARAVQPLVGADDEHRECIAVLIHHLDRLPLAIELAAARTKTLPIPEIVTRLDDRFRLLRQTRHTGPAHHDGLEAAIAWSYDLLFEDERRTFRRLSVCSGGITADVAERLCGPDALDLASRLVDRSLLAADTGGGAVRFTMLESLRAFGLARLADDAGLEAARTEHLDWCIEFATRVHREARGPHQLHWLARLDEEHENLRAALGRAVIDDPERALQLVGELVLPWWFRGRRQEIREWADAALAAAGDMPPSPARARVLSLSGLIAEPRLKPGAPPTDLRAELALAATRQREALDIDEANDDAEAIAYDCLVLLSTLTRQASTGEALVPGEAENLFARGVELADHIGDDFASGLIRITDSMLAVAQGNRQRSAATIQDARRFVDRLGERFSLSRLEFVCGMLDELADAPREAYGHIERSLRLVDELGIHHAVTAQARLLVPLAERCGEARLAAQWRSFVEGRGAGWTHYDGSVMASAHNQDGLRARAEGDLDRAVAAHRAALEWYLTANIAAGIAFSQSSLGFLATARGDEASAVCHHAAALVAAAASDDPNALALALEGAAALATNAGDCARAAQLLGAARVRWASEAFAVLTHRSDVDEVVKRARSALGEMRFEQLAAAGARLDRRAAIVLGRSGRPGVDRPSTTLVGARS